MNVAWLLIDVGWIATWASRWTVALLVVRRYTKHATNGLASDYAATRAEGLCIVVLCAAYIRSSGRCCSPRLHASIKMFSAII